MIKAAFVDQEAHPKKPIRNLMEKGIIWRVVRGKKKEEGRRRKIKEIL
jgi:hypothetical protein